MKVEEKKLEINEEKIEDKETQIKKAKNVNLYKKYRVFSWDMLFYYAIIYLFLTVEKGFSAADVLKVDAFYIFFKFLTQIPCTILIQKVGKRRSLMIANFIASIHILIIIFANSFSMLLVSQLLCAIAFIIKATCESDMLYDSIEHGEKRGIIFSKIDGKAMSKYYYIDAISAVFSGFLFVINPYIPMFTCFAILFVSFLVSTKFEEIHIKEKKITIKEELKNIKIALKNTFKSKRLKSLILFNGIFVGIIKILQNIRNTVLVKVGMPNQYFGIIFAALGIISGIASKNQGKIHKKYRNKTLAFLSIPTVTTCLMMGIILLMDLPKTVSITLILILFAIQYIMKGPYYVLIKQYFNNFTNSEKRVKISTINNLLENLIASILVFGASAILEVISIEYTTIIIGCISVILVTLILDYMRGIVGLKMEDYSKKELL